METIPPTNPQDSRFITKKLAAQEVITQINYLILLNVVLTTTYLLNLAFRTKFTIYSSGVDAIFLGVAGVAYYWAHKKKTQLKTKYS